MSVKAALFDIDGTLTSGGKIWYPLIKSPDVPAWRRAWLYATAYPHYMLSQRGVVSQAAFRDRWVRLMAWLTTGWTREQVQALSARIVDEVLLTHLRDDVVALLHEHRDQGRPTILVSTMFGCIVRTFNTHIGAEAALGSEVEFRDDISTGRIVGQTCSGGRKAAFVQRYLAEHHPEITLADCAAYADSHSDIPFLESVGHPVAVYPDEAMRAVAEARGWPIHAVTDTPNRRE